MLALEAHGRLRFAQEALLGLRHPRRVGSQELEGHPLMDGQVRRGDDEAHSPRAEDAIDAVLSGQHVAGSDG